MRNRLKQFFTIVVLGAVLYFFLSFHLILIGNTIKFLKKSRLTLEYTFFNAKGKTNKTILSYDDLREDGIGDILVEMGRMSEGEYDRLLRKYEDHYEYD